MASSSISAEQYNDDASSLDSGAELSVAYKVLRHQLEEHKSLIEKKSEVIVNQQARIAVLEEQLRLKTVERFAASSESNPLQSRLFNEVEQADDEVEAGAVKNDEAEAGNNQPAKARPKRRGLNPDIPRVQQRLLLSDEQREGAIDTFFVSVKEELDITPATVQVIEYLQEKAVYLDDNGDRKLRVAERPPHPLGKSVASVSLLAYLVIAKYIAIICRCTVWKAS